MRKSTLYLYLCNTILAHFFSKLKMEWRRKIVELYFGQKLKELRRISGMTQKQLASRLGITKSTVSFYERHERMPSPEIMSKIASIFHVSIDVLMGREKIKTIDVSDLSEEDIKVIQIIVDRFREKNQSR